jgi:hypothetical protein
VEVIWLAQHSCFRYHRKSEFDGKCFTESIFHGSNKVIPEIIKVKVGLMLGVEFDFDVSALRRK